MPEKRLEDMSKEEIWGIIKRGWKKTNIATIFEEVDWALSEPKCPCDSCDEIYQEWVKQGKELYERNKSNMEYYEKKVEEANLRREQRKEERKLSRQVRGGSQRLVNAYSC